MANVRLMEMDAAALSFEDDSFDVVYAPYVMSVVPDPVQVVREMRRVCRPGGRILILNHFLSSNPVLAMVEKAISPMTVHVGFKSDLDLPRFLFAGRAAAGIDSEGDAANLVARHLREGLASPACISTRAR